MYQPSLRSTMQSTCYQDYGGVKLNPIYVNTALCSKKRPGLPVPCNGKSSSLTRRELELRLLQLLGTLLQGVYIQVTLEVLKDFAGQEKIFKARYQGPPAVVKNFPICRHFCWQITGQHFSKHNTSQSRILVWMTYSAHTLKKCLRPTGNRETAVEVRSIYLCAFN